MYDLIIIGAGPAGITASVYAARKRMKFLVIAGDVGGQTALTGDIENYTGYQFITGIDLSLKFEEHIKKYNIEVKEETVTRVERTGDAIAVKTEKNEYGAETAIIATGARWRELGVPGEREFKNRGLTYCATCDGPLFAGKDVAVIGGGNSGLEATIQLQRMARKVYVLDIAPKLSGDKILEEKIAQAGTVEILTKTRVKRITGDKMVKGILVEREGSEKIIDVQGVFVEIGLIPNSEFARGVKKNKAGEIEINAHNETNVQGIFAAGDVTSVRDKQIIVAAGEGAKAALSVFTYLAHKE